MPVDFLSSEQELKYGKFTDEPTAEQLAKYFWLDDQDRVIVNRMRNDTNRLGYAIQLGTVKFLGTFLSDPTDIPSNVSHYVAQQLNINESCIKSYNNSRTFHNHAQEIRQLYGYHDFSEQHFHFRLVRWLYTRAWLTAERPSVLFDLATARCVEQKILLPGVTVLARLIAQIRDKASLRLWYKLSRLPAADQILKLEHLLEADIKTRKTGLDILRQPPSNLSVTGIIKALERLEEIRSLGAAEWNISGIPLNRIRVLSRYASMARAQSISRMPYNRRIATLVAFGITYTITAMDDVLDILDKFLTDMFSRSDRRGQKNRIRTIKDLDRAARKLREVCALLLNDEMTSQDLLSAIFSKISKDDLRFAVQTVDNLTRPPEQKVSYDELFKNYTTIRKFLPKLMNTIEFQATPSGQQALEAWEFLYKCEFKTNRNKFLNAPLSGITPDWRRAVFKESINKVSPCAYTFWTIGRLLENLKHHDIYVSESERYGDPRAQLLQGETWESIRPHVLRTLDWKSSAEEALKPLAKELDAAYKRTSKRWNDNNSVRIENFAGQERLVLTPLDKLEESISLIHLRKRVQSLLPRTDLPELLLEVDRWTGFTKEFIHINQGGTRVNDLTVSICAVLIAQACNIGLEPVVQPGIPALEYDRLTWVDQNYFRSETITQANAALVDFHSKIKLTQTWGGGEVASADGLRFVTPVKTINSGPNPKYFGTGRGVTYYNFTSDQFSGFHGIVIPGTIRDSLYLLEGILEQQTVLQPREVMTDTAGYSDIVFGLFGLLGYQFSPRLADIGDSKFWKFDPDADYGVLNTLSRGRIRKDIIIKHWDDMIRVAGSLKLGTVHPTQLIQTFQRGGKPTMLARAIGEFGRIYKTQYLLAYLDDENYRRRILTQLNRGESRHSLARAIFYGKRGELHQSYREGQEDQLGALGLVVNAIIIWNTRYMELALEAIKNSGKSIDEADIQRLSPLGYDHINIMGKYSFILPTEIEHGGLRKLLEVDKISEV